MQTRRHCNWRINAHSQCCRGMTSKGNEMTKEVQMTHGYITVVDDEDYEQVSRWKWYPFSNGPRRYAIGNSGVLMHRLLLDPPNGVHVDHINGNGLDNRRENLRMCTPEINARNKGDRRITRSKHDGVYKIELRKPWLASIMIDGVEHYLGMFATEEEAAQAHDVAMSALENVSG